MEEMEAEETAELLVSHILHNAVSKAVEIREYMNISSPKNDDDATATLSTKLNELIPLIERNCASDSSAKISPSIAANLLKTLENCKDILSGHTETSGADDSSFVRRINEFAYKLHNFTLDLQSNLGAEVTEELVNTTILLLRGHPRQQQNNSNVDAAAIAYLTINNPEEVLKISYNRLLGAGHFGAVYGGKLYDKDVAVKVLKETADQFHRKSFRKEALFLQSLRHPGIVTYYGCLLDEYQNPRILTLELAHCNLSDLIHRSAAGQQQGQGTTIPSSWFFKLSDIARKLSYALQICQALEFLHRHKVLHRDIKPPNIIITNDEKPKLIDFGLAKGNDFAPGPTSTNFAGTEAYLSPECLRFGNRAYTAAADVYSFGIMLNELFSQRIPFCDIGRSHHRLSYFIVDKFKIPLLMDVEVLIAAVVIDEFNLNLDDNEEDEFRVNVFQVLETIRNTIILKTWNRNIETRPDFATIASILQGLYDGLNVLWQEMKLKKFRKRPRTSVDDDNHNNNNDDADDADDNNRRRRGGNDFARLPSFLAPGGDVLLQRNRTVSSSSPAHQQQLLSSVMESEVEDELSAASSSKQKLPSLHEIDENEEENDDYDKDDGNDENNDDDNNNVMVMDVVSSSPSPSSQSTPNNHNTKENVVVSCTKSRKITIDNKSIPRQQQQQTQISPNNCGLQILKECFLNTIIHRRRSDIPEIDGRVLVVLNCQYFNPLFDYEGTKRSNIFDINNTNNNFFEKEEYLSNASDYAEKLHSTLYPVNPEEMVFTPSVIVDHHLDEYSMKFIPAHKPRVVGVLAIPAVPVGYYYMDDEELVEKKLTSTILFAIEHGYKELILTTWSFNDDMRSNPQFIAQWYHHLWMRYGHHFDHWSFCIWNDDPAYVAFRDVFHPPSSSSSSSSSWSRLLFNRR